MVEVTGTLMKTPNGMSAGSCASFSNRFKDEVAFTDWVSNNISAGCVVSITSIVRL